MSIGLIAGRSTQQLLDSLCLHQIWKDPTERGILFLDITDLPSTAITIAKIATSDHNPVLVRFKVSEYRDKPYILTYWCYTCMIIKPTSGIMRGYLFSVEWSEVFSKIIVFKRAKRLEGMQCRTGQFLICHFLQLCFSGAFSLLPLSTQYTRGILEQIPRNYRPISLLSNISKVMESKVNHLLQT